MESLKRTESHLPDTIPILHTTNNATKTWLTPQNTETNRFMITIARILLLLRIVLFTIAQGFKC